MDKLTLLLLLLTWLTAGQQAAVAPKPVLLFIIDGQSNAGSLGDAAKLGPEWNRTDPDVRFYSPQALKHSRWVPVAPHPFANARFKVATGFGVELSFGHAMKKAFPDHIIAVARRNSGGTSIIAWDKGWERAAWKTEMPPAENRPAQYPLLLSFVEDARTALAREPGVGPVHLAAFIWIQGERDSRYELGAKQYETRLRALIANVRQDLKAPDLPFLFGEAHSWPKFFMDTVDRAVRAVASDVPRTSLVLLKDLSTYEGDHFDSEGTLELGRRFAAAFLQMGSVPRP